MIASSTVADPATAPDATVEPVLDRTVAPGPDRTVGPGLDRTVGPGLETAVGPGLETAVGPGFAGDPGTGAAPGASSRAVLGTGRPVRHLAALGDSTAVGLGDPSPGGGWRGFAPLLRDALSAPGSAPVRLDNHARNGARMAGTRYGQVPAAAAARPDVVVLCAGMNDTMRGDFAPAAVRRDCAEAITLLGRAGAAVYLVRYHDHGRVFRLPAVLRRALSARIAALNAALDGAVADAAGAGTDAGVLDLAGLDCYDLDSWSVDRLHPSERGHRLLARGFAALLAADGWAVPGTVGVQPGGGRRVTRWQRGSWLVLQGVPWLCRRGHDLGPVIARGIAEGMRSRVATG